jgi:hypothetical protein
MGVILVLAIAMLSVPTLAQGIAGNGGVDILGRDGGIFETEGAAFRFPEQTDINVDTLTVGNDRALAFGGLIPWTRMATATNNLEIKKNQDSGECACCQALDASSPCKDCCTKVNIDQISVGNRQALAFGFAAATNNVKIVANQQ